MKLIKNITAASTVVLFFGVASTALAQAPLPNNSGASAATAIHSAEMADGEIRKVDKATRKITIKHGEIKNLDMPSMTMLFHVSDVAMLDRVKPGDKVKFKAENANGAIVVTEIHLVP